MYEFKSFIVQISLFNYVVHFLKQIISKIHLLNSLHDKMSIALKFKYYNYIRM